MAVVKDHASFIRLLAEDSASTAPTDAVLTYISSLHFPQYVINDYYQRADGRAMDRSYLEHFTTMRANFKRNIGKFAFRFIYPLAMLRRFAANGQVHDAYNFRPTPEIVGAVFADLRECLLREPNFQVCLTREKIPFVFVRRQERVILDIRENVVDQSIQGLVLDSAEVADFFAREFVRIWNSGKSISRRDDVVARIDAMVEELSHTGTVWVREEARDELNEVP